MAADPVTALLNIGEGLLLRLFPDPAERARQSLELQRLAKEERTEELQAHVSLMLGQLDVNKAEAQHKSIFVAGWRPATGWVCSVSLALAFIPKAAALTIIWVWQCVVMLSSYSAAIEALAPGAAIPVMPELPAYPNLGLGDVLGILGGMLGMGTMRSLDKRAGVSTEKVGS